MADTKSDFLNELKEEFKELGSKVSKMYEEFTGKNESAPGDFQFRVDIWETNDSFILAADLPGMTREEVKVQIADNNLVISGDRKTQSGIGDVNWHKKERTFGAFKRSFAIPAGVNADAIRAKFDNGVLMITLSKADAAKEKSEISID